MVYTIVSVSNPMPFLYALHTYLDTIKTYPATSKFVLLINTKSGEKTRTLNLEKKPVILQLFFSKLSKRRTYDSECTNYVFISLYLVVNINHAFQGEGGGHAFNAFVICIVYGDEHVCFCQIKCLF